MTDHKLDEATIRACIEALPEESGTLLLSNPPQTPPFDLCIRECRAALEALLPKPDPVTRWRAPRAMDLSPPDSFEALVSSLEDYINDLISKGWKAP